MPRSVRQLATQGLEIWEKLLSKYEERPLRGVATKGTIPLELNEITKTSQFQISNLVLSRFHGKNKYENTHKKKTLINNILCEGRQPFHYLLQLLLYHILVSHTNRNILARLNIYSKILTSNCQRSKLFKTHSGSKKFFPSVIKGCRMRELCKPQGKTNVKTPQMKQPSVTPTRQWPNSKQS